MLDEYSHPVKILFPFTVSLIQYKWFTQTSLRPLGSDKIYKYNYIYIPK